MADFIPYDLKNPHSFSELSIMFSISFSKICFLFIWYSFLSSWFAIDWWLSLSVSKPDFLYFSNNLFILKIVEILSEPIQDFKIAFRSNFYFSKVHQSLHLINKLHLDRDRSYSLGNQFFLVVLQVFLLCTFSVNHYTFYCVS